MYTKTTILVFILAFTANFASSQTIADLENISIPASEYLDDSGTAGLFPSGNAAFYNFFDQQFFYWEGWAISKVTDNTTPGFTNQYSAITGKGVNNSANYAVGYSYSGNAVGLTGAAAGGYAKGVYITNNTYTYFSMKNGDSFAKKFGGETGNDPDFLKLTIKKSLNGQIGADSIDFFLADYRFANNAQDYIVNTWQYIDLRPLGNSDSLLFYLRSTDNGDFGMNTPAYFCLDNLETGDQVSGTSEQLKTPAIAVWPNPATDQIRITIPANTTGLVQITDQNGRVVLQEIADHSTSLVLQTTSLQAGMYYCRIVGDVQAFAPVKLIVR